VLRENFDNRSTPASSSASEWAVATAVYLITAIVYFAVPIWRTFGESLLGSTLFGPDNVLNAGILEWGYKVLRSSALHLFDWPSGYPMHNTLAGTENLIGWQPMFFPQRLLGIGIVSAYNICILLSFVVSGLTGNLFARRCGVPNDGALIAGFIFAFAPLHVGLAVQFQSLIICWLPLGIVLFERVLAERSIGNIVGLAFVVVMTTLGSLYYGVFLALILAVWYPLGLATRRFERSWAGAARIGVAAALTLGTMLPFAVQYVRVSSMFGFDRSLAFAIERSMGIADFFMLQSWLLLWGKSPLANRINYGAAFPGLVVLVLLVASIRWKAPRHLRLSLLAVAALCAILSLGPRLKVFNYPTSFLENVPMPGAILGVIPGIRMPSRFLPCAFIFVAVLAGGGASGLLAWRPEWRRVTVPVLLLAAALDAFPAPSFAAESWRLRAPLASSDAYAYLAQSPDTSAVVELPKADSTGFTLPAKSAYVYGSIGHLRRTVSYNLSVNLPATDSLQAEAERLPDESARALLVARGVRRLVVHNRFFKADSAAARLARLNSAGYPVLFRGRDATVYSLDRASSGGTP
jgi:hypothetical protein